MKTVLNIGSLAMLVTGIFCLANGNAAFISVAFIIGIVLSLIGVVEFFIGRRTGDNSMGVGFSLLMDGIILFILGIVILAGQITDDITAQMLFALLLVIEGSLAAGGYYYKTVKDTGNVDVVLSIMMLLIGIYTFFNTRLLNIDAIAIIGVSLIILGLRRFRLSLAIEYTKPGFLTGNEERLMEAEAEEKKALAKAKEGIREQKIAQRRIEKIKSEMEEESTALNEGVKNTDTKEE